MRVALAILAILALATMATEAAAKPHDFRVIDTPYPALGAAEAVAVSADGSVVVGSCGTPDGQRAFLWTLGAGSVLLDMPTDGPTMTWATDVSANGNYVSGYGGTSFGTRSGWEGLFWHAGSGTPQSILVPGSGVWGKGISGDGTTVVGTYQGTAAADQSMAFHWSASDGVVHPLGTLYDSMTTHASNATAIAANGSTIVGDSHGVDPGFGNDGFRWTAADGMTGLGGVYMANAVSRDGQVIVGTANGSNGFEAFRWTAAGGIELLGVLGPNQTSQALGVSGDGRRVVGFVEDQSTDLRTAFIWEEGVGMRLVQDVLANDFGFGNELDDWSLTKVYAISDDWSTLVGRAYKISEGKEYAFRAVFPEPATLSLLALGGLGVLLRRKRR